MIQRVRDVVRNIRPQETISYEEWQDIMDRFARATQFLDEKNPIYITFQEDLKNAENIVLENRIHEVQEVKTITKAFKKIFLTPREEQLNELVGQVKYLRGILAEINSWITRKEELEKQEADGRITIDRDGR